VALAIVAFDNDSAALGLDLEEFRRSMEVHVDDVERRVTVDCENAIARANARAGCRRMREDVLN